MRCFFWAETGLRDGIHVSVYRDGWRATCTRHKYMMLSTSSPPDMEMVHEGAYHGNRIFNACPIPFTPKNNENLTYYVLAKPDYSRLEGTPSENAAVIKVTTRLSRTPQAKNPNDKYYGINIWSGSARILMAGTDRTDNPLTGQSYEYCAAIVECRKGSVLQVIQPDLFSTRVFLRYNGECFEQLSYEDLSYEED